MVEILLLLILLVLAGISLGLSITLQSMRKKLDQIVAELERLSR